MSIFSLQNLTIQKEGFSILENISFEINEQQRWAIVGANGAGKSTLIDLLAGRIFPSSGILQKPSASDIVLVPRDYGFDRLVQASSQYYQQRFNAFDAEISPTVYDVIQRQVKPVGTLNDGSVALPPPLYSRHEVEQKARLLRVEHLLERRVVTLSNGETRRVLLTIALLKNPKVLLLDNPFVGLDVASRQTLHQIIDGIADTQIVMATTPKEIPASVTHLLMLKNGQVEQIQERPFTIPKATDNQQFIDQNILEKIKNEPQDDGFEAALSFENVSVGYGTKKILDNVNWHIKRGEKWALIGPNGSGKSTLLSLINADNPQGYQKGVVLFDRQRGSGESIWDIKKRIGFVSPELHLFFDRSAVVWKVVASGLFDAAGLFRKLTPEQEQKVQDFLGLFRYNSLADRRLNQLSTGQQRMVFLLRALIKNPPLLVLDEPCQGLDYDQMIRFRDLVNTLTTTLNKTLIYVTHYEEEIPDCVGQRLVLGN